MKRLPLLLLMAITTIVFSFAVTPARAGTWEGLVLTLDETELGLTNEEARIIAIAYLLTDIGKKLCKEQGTDKFSIQRDGNKIILVPVYYILSGPSLTSSSTPRPA